MLLRSEKSAQRDDDTAEAYDYRTLLSLVESKAAKVGIIGLGYVGLPLALAAVRAGVTTRGFDLDSAKVVSLSQGRSYIRHIPNDLVNDAISGGRFSVTTDFSSLWSVDVILICVPTPIAKNCSPEIKYIVDCAKTIRKHLRPGQLIVLESTTYPGTTTGELRDTLEETGLVSGKDFFLAFSPEREDPGNKNFSTVQIPKIVGGHGPEATIIAESLYRSFGIKTVTVSSPDTAEAVKLTENVFRSVNIAMINELKIIFDRMGIDIWEVIQAADTKPFGFMAFYPGPGVGGHCIPADPYFLTSRAREFNVSARLVEVACEINRKMPEHVVDGIARALDSSQQRAVSGSRVLVLGVAYKRNIDDTRDSPALQVMDLLMKRNALVEYHDSFVPIIPRIPDFPNLSGLRSVEMNPETLQEFDVVIVTTDHDGVDYEMIATHARLVIDTRNIFGRRGMDGVHIVKL